MNPDDLIQKYIDDRAGMSEDELERLIGALRASPERAISLREQLLMDDLVSQKLAFDRRNFFAQVEQRIADYERGEEEIQNQVVELRTLAESEFERPAAHVSDGGWWKIAVVVAALAVIGFVALDPPFSGSKSEQIASIESLQGDASLQGEAGQTALHAGQIISTGQQLVTPAGASLRLRFQDATLVDVVAESTVKIDIDRRTGGKLVHLDRGELVAVVPKQARGRPMVFATPHALATVLGTTLRLTVTDSATRLDVTEGKVELCRKADNQTLIVSTNKSGVAAQNNLALHELRWPDNRDGMIFLFDGDIRNTLVRSSKNAQVLQLTELTPSGDASPSGTGPIVLRGGAYSSQEAGADLLPLLTRTNQFSLELVFQADSATQPRMLPIVSLNDSDTTDDALAANLVLGHDENGLVLFLRLDSSGIRPREIPLGNIEPGKRVHLSVAYRNGELIVALDGKRRLRVEDVRGEFSNWKEPYLVIGNALLKDVAWHGKVNGIAIYNRFLDEAEMERNVRSFKQINRAEKQPQE